MFKTIRDVLIGVFVAATVSAAVAITGTPPGTGFQLIDGTWLTQLAAGNNFSAQNSITAHAGGTQAACLVLNNSNMIYELDTVASASDSICLPYAAAGDATMIRNAGANAAALFAQSSNNPLTAATDTINGLSNASSLTLSANWVALCFSGKNGVWSCGRSN